VRLRLHLMGPDGLSKKTPVAELFESFDI